MPSRGVCCALSVYFMNVWKYFAALPLLAVSVWAASPAVNELVLPEEMYPQLDSMLKRAVQQSPRMVDKLIELEMAENSRIEARAGLLPNLSGSGRFYKARDKRADRPGENLDVDKAFYDVSVTQPIFYWGERRNNARIGAIQKSITEGNYREGYRLLAQEIRRTYLQLIVHKIHLERTRIANKFDQDARTLAESRLQAGVASEAEIFGARLTAERSQINLERTEHELETGLRSLSRLTGVTVTEQDIATEIPTINYQAQNIEQVLAGFLSQKDPPTPQAEALRKQMNIDDLAYRNQKTRLLPKFSFQVGLNQDEQSYTTNSADRYQVDSMYAGLSVNWTIFDGFAASAGKANALARRRLNENQYRALTEQLAIDAQAHVKSLNFSARSMSITDRILVSAAGSYQARKAEFARGVVSENNVIQDHLSYYEALISADNARIDYLIRLADFLGLVAEDPVLANASTN